MECKKAKNMNNINSIALEINMAKGEKEDNFSIAPMLDMLPTMFIKGTLSELQIKADFSNMVKKINKQIKRRMSEASRSHLQ